MPRWSTHLKLFTMSVKIHTQIEALRPLLRRLAANDVPAEAEMIYSGRNRVYKYFSPEIGKEVNIKCFHVPHIINQIVYGTFRDSKARRAYFHALRLRRAGFHTPEPLGFVEVSAGPLFRRAYFVSEQLQGYTDVREIHSKGICHDVLNAVAQVMAELHRKEVWMKDFSQGNVLYRRESDGSFDIQIVDINRMRFDENRSHLLMRNFSTITDHPDDLEYLAESYAKAMDMPKALVLPRARAAFRSRH